MDHYSERGGAWLGQTYWSCLAGTWPFGAIRVTRESIEVSIGVWPLVRRVVIPAGGVQGREMPAWGTVLTDQQIADVSQYVYDTFVVSSANSPR